MSRAALLILATALILRHAVEMSPTSAPMTARARARAELTEEIKREARHQLAEHGTDLSLRAVARELGMASSAVYRYFPSRDDLLTALIVDAYDALGETAELALSDAHEGVSERWVALSMAVRCWAVEHPHDYALLYGSPVPGYRAPQDTIAPAERVSLVALGIMHEGVASGEISLRGSLPVSRAVRNDLSALSETTGLDIPDHVLARGLLIWTALFGSISFELFGHFHNVIHDYPAFFESQMRRAARYLISGDGHSG
jgi:AcrR family transcriptional regulator